MVLVLVAILVTGAQEGRRGVVLTASIALVVTQLPALLRRNLRVELDPWLALWLTSAVFVHAIGTGGIPGVSGYLYGVLPWLDHLTHALSASVVAGTGYTVVRALDLHSESLHFPDRFMFAFVLLFVMATGVAWEILEFSIGAAPQIAGHGREGFAQGALDDTVLDLVFNTVGAAVVAATAHLYLNGTILQVRKAFGDDREHS